MQYISESDLRREVADLLHKGPRKGLPCLLREFHVRSKPEELARLELLVKALCAQSYVWLAEFKKRATNHARCPSWLRPQIAQWITATPKAQIGGTRITAPDVLRRMRRARSQEELIIKDKGELGYGDAYRHFRAKLHTLEQKELPIDLLVRFECCPVYVHGLALLAAWCERNASRVRLVVNEPTVRHYLKVTGFKDVVENELSIRAPLYDGENHVALTRFDRENLAGADDVACRLVDLFDHHLCLEPSQRPPLMITFAELVENVYRHAESNYGSYVMAQAFPSTGKLHVTIADSGIGVFASFRASKDSAVQQRASNDAKTIQMALERLVTSKTEKHSGYGLFVVKRLVEKNEGWMRFTSGRISWETWIAATRWGRRQRKQRIVEYLPWKGTEVSLIFNLDMPLPLKDVYAELGPPDDAGDFFDLRKC